MFCQVTGQEDEDVVEVDEHKPVQEIPQHVIHQGLKNSWKVSKTKGQDLVFVVAQQGVECDLPFISLMDGRRYVGLTWRTWWLPAMARRQN